MGWDIGRFFKTLVFFGAVPMVSQADWFVQLTGQKGDVAYAQPESPAAVVLVVGTDSVSREIASRLAERGDRVRLVNFAATPLALPPSVEVIAGAPETLAIAPVVADVSTTIVCSAGSAETAFLSRLIPQLVPSTQPSERLLFDFRSPTPDLLQVWGPVDDVVMGGVSSSGIRMGDRAAIFSGIVSTDNSGGFASVRTRNLEPVLDLSGFDGIRLRLRGDGQRYKFFLRDEQRWDGIAYSFSFDTIANTWIDVRIPFQQLVPVMRAKTVSGVEVTTQSITALQVMLSKFEYDGALNPSFRPGEFQLEIEAIAAYGPPAPQAILLDAAVAEFSKQLEMQGLVYASVTGEGSIEQCLEAIGRPVAAVPQQ